MQLVLSRLAAATALAVLASGASAQILNGSFEQPTVPTGGFTTFSGGVPNWEIVNGTVDVVSGSLWGNRSAADGVQMLDLSGNDSPTRIRQSFSSVAGQEYAVTFQFWSNPDSNETAFPGSGGAGRTGKSYVTDAGGFAVSPFLSFASAIDSQNWAQATYSIIGTGGDLFLNFEGTAFRAYGVLLDDVSVTAVPEPGTYALMLAGLGVVGFMARRRQAGKGQRAAGALPAAA